MAVGVFPRYHDVNTRPLPWKQRCRGTAERLRSQPCNVSSRIIAALGVGACEGILKRCAALFGHLPFWEIFSDGVGVPGGRTLT
eukprot:2230288-Rhodomonas_salina.1